MKSEYEGTGEVGAKLDWSEVRRHYEAGNSSVEQVCLHHNISRSMLYRRIKRDGWLKRRKVLHSRKARKFLPDELLGRLSRVVAWRIEGLESSRLTEFRAEPPLESERQARAIVALVRALEQIVALQDRLRETRKKADDGDDTDTACWRADMAEALAGLAKPETTGNNAERGETRDGLGNDSSAGPASAVGRRNG